MEQTKKLLAELSVDVEAPYLDHHREYSRLCDVLSMPTIQAAESS